jgi:hypothetical protein
MRFAQGVKMKKARLASRLASIFFKLIHLYMKEFLKVKALEMCSLLISLVGILIQL